MNEDIDMKENKVQEKLFKELENLQGNEKKYRKRYSKNSMIYKEIVISIWKDMTYD